jgi:hypothetical protein
MEIDPLGSKVIADMIVDRAYAHEQALVERVLFKMDKLLDKRESRAWQNARALPKILEKIGHAIVILAIFSTFCVFFPFFICALAHGGPPTWALCSMPNVTQDDFVLFRAWSILIQMLPKNETF